MTLGSLPQTLVSSVCLQVISVLRGPASEASCEFHFIFNFYLLIYLFESEHTASGWGGWRGRERILSKLHAHCRAQHGPGSQHP